VSFPVATPAHGDTLRCSNLSWANVEASVMCPPKELFLVVVIMSPARAKRDMARMSMAIRTSTIEKPFDFIDKFIATPLNSSILEFILHLLNLKPTPLKEQIACHTV
jgi:hypothetical protein